MDVIFAYIEKLPIIPDNWNLTIAQVLSALLFVGILYAVARVASWFFNGRRRGVGGHGGYQLAPGVYYG